MAIVYASQVNTKAQAGDIAGAQESSENDKMWCLISSIVGIIANIAAIAFQSAILKQQGAF